jgi:DNA replication protein DnaC
MSPTANTILAESLSRLQASFINSRVENERFLSTLPAATPCAEHPQMIRPRDDQQSLRAQRAVFRLCELCEAERRQLAEIEKLQGRGVPLILCTATFDNWTPADDGDAANLETAREFSRVRRGFLILLGELGTGKSHLAVAAFRTFNRGWFIKQSELLRRLRQTYRDKAAVDPIDEAQNAGCLVLDEIGVSPGGRDEFPLLHDVLDHRHGNQKPTILTGNLTLDELRAVIGDRMSDRIRESAFAVLNFGGVSRRGAVRDNYFQATSQQNL